MGWTIFPGAPVGDELGVELALGPDFCLCAQGGRSDWSWLNAIPAKSSAGTASSEAERGRMGLINIGS